MPKSLGRRGWLESLLPVAADAAAELKGLREGPPPRRRRPPGALEEERFLELCTRCGECIVACPHGAVLYYNEKAPPSIQSTPVMRPERRACEMCDGFPCAVSCEPGALQVPSERFAAIGVVRIAEDRCIAYLGPECGACVDACPHPLRAITLERWRPVVDREACVGCGRCIHRCPTSPPAIAMEPLEPD